MRCALRPLLAPVVVLAAAAALPATAAPPPRGPAVVTAGAPLRVAVDAEQVSDGSAFIPAEADPRAHPLPSCRGEVATGQPAGEGLLAVTMAGPGTSWSSATATSVVVDLAVDGGPTQQVVLYDGAAPFTYTGFVGALATGAHCVSVTVRPDLSVDPAGTPTAAVYDVALGVLPAAAPAYLLETHAPVLYGRSTSAEGDTPLLTYGAETDAADGTTARLSYVVVWTHEDVGTGLVPVDEWGSWGRMTDIETVLNETVNRASGHVLSASYLSCGCEALPAYPDLAPELPPQGETDQPFTGAYYGQHAVLRDATGNNDIAPSGTTAFRFQQTLVAPPAAGQLRDAVMEAHPWTYRISNDELVREDAFEYSTDPRDFLVGDCRQYLIADIDAAPQGTSSVAVEVQLNGDPTWYSNDYEQASAGVASTYPFYTGGHGRTVVKLPTDWLSKGIAAVRLRLNTPPGSTATPTLGLRSLTLIGLTPDWQVVYPAYPPVTTTTATALVTQPIG